MAAYNIWAGVEVGESLPEGSQVVIGIPCKGLGKRPNIYATKKTNEKPCTFEARKDSPDQGDEMINVEVGHIDNQPPHTASPPYSMKQSMMNLHILKAPPYSMKQSMMKHLPPLLEIFKLFKKGRQLNMIQWDKICLI
ncbi:hypothetical protein O181_080201 [Austropuccinia psidii MF-1]|uniref:Uncharacterized protein n=1 Tax=Austropuccinia psidii MF-1 TaxID=1389203 RepID=A0A9Q3FNB6_9BASI|nr:hypothetical protein [Austropuccinia psidii MF-1]